MTPDELNARRERLATAMEEDAANLMQILNRKAERTHPVKNDSESFGVAPATIPPFRDQLDTPPPSPDQWAAMIEHVSRYGCLPPGDGTGHVQTRDAWLEEEFVELTPCHNQTGIPPGMMPPPPPPITVRPRQLDSETRVFWSATVFAAWVFIATVVVRLAGGGR